MQEERKVDLFEIDTREFASLTPSRARDLIVECFYNAQKETLTRAKQRLGNEHTESSLQQSALNIVKIALKDTGGNFNQPSKEELGNIVPILAKSCYMGNPERYSVPS